MFPKNQRITKQEDFDKIFKFGKPYYSDFLGVRILKNNHNTRRFGLVISKKVSNKAVIRNKIKRHLRAILKKHQEKFLPATDIIIYTQPLITNKAFTEIERAILDICAIIK